MTTNQKITLISILGGIANAFLSFIKILVGLKVASQALIAEGIHSLSDVAVSLVTYIGIRKARQPADKEHPYGHEKYENITSLLIAVILIITGLFIIKDALQSLWLKEHLAHFTWWSIGIMSISLLVNAFTFRLKVFFGKKYSSLALVADGQHDKMDMLVSIGVLGGLFLVGFYSWADTILSLLLGMYIVYESYELAKVSIDGLVDAANPELEKKIIEFLREQGVDFSKISTRRLGSKNEVDLEMNLPADLKVEVATQKVKEIEEKIKNNFQEVSQVIIRVHSHDIEDYYVRSPWGRGYRFQKKIAEKLISSPKPVQGRWRCIIPLDGQEINFNDFGAQKFLVLDFEKKGGNLLEKFEVTNPFWEEERGHGIQFVAWIKANKVVTGHIGPNAIKNLAAMKVELAKVPQGVKLEEALEKYC